MLVVGDDGCLLKDARGHFLNEVLTMGTGFAEFAPGTVPASRRDDGYKKYYRAIFCPANLLKMEECAKTEPCGPIARFLELRQALDAVPELAPSQHVCGCRLATIRHSTRRGRWPTHSTATMCFSARRRRRAARIFRFTDSAPARRSRLLPAC